MSSEFELIARYFTRPVRHTELGVGDDAAILRPRAGTELAVSTDMLVAGVHFLDETDPARLGWKALAVNLSDLAAMGAEPRWALLAISLPAADDDWVASFAQGFFGLAERFQVDVVGGDTARGPLTITPTVIGEIPSGQALRRAGASPGDDLWVSGAPGRAALGLAHLRGQARLEDPTACMAALEQPLPRIELGVALRGIASAAIDVSDGLLADLGHILECSTVSAELRDEALPWDGLPNQGASETLRRQCLLAGGDDYELLFAAPAERRGEIEEIGRACNLPLSLIGRVVGDGGCQLRLLDAGGRPLPIGQRGYDHFA